MHVGHNVMLVLFVISDNQQQVTWFKLLHFQMANVWRLHCDPPACLLAWRRVSSLGEINKAPCQLPRLHWDFKSGESLRVSWLPPPSIAWLHFYDPKKEHLQVAAVA